MLRALPNFAPQSRRGHRGVLRGRGGEPSLLSVVSASLRFSFSFGQCHTPEVHRPHGPSQCTSAQGKRPRMHLLLGPPSLFLIRRYRCTLRAHRWGLSENAFLQEPAITPIQVPVDGALFPSNASLVLCTHTRSRQSADGVYAARRSCGVGWSQN